MSLSEVEEEVSGLNSGRREQIEVCQGWVEEREREEKRKKGRERESGGGVDSVPQDGPQ